MGYQIIKQPDGQFAIFSTMTDTIVMWNATERDIIDWFVSAATLDTHRQITRILTHVRANNPREIYAQFAMTWQEALEEDRDHHGEASKMVDWKEGGLIPDETRSSRPENS
jgi:hypothetical protein